jgi:hypothetical protein
MPAASTLPGAQLLSSATFRAQIRDSQSTPVYLFSRATVFNRSRNPRQKICANGLNPMFTEFIIPNWYCIGVVSLPITHVRAFVSTALVCALLSFPALAERNYAPLLFRRGDGANQRGPGGLYRDGAIH